MLRELDLLTPQERKAELLVVFSSYSSPVTALLIASQVSLDFTYIAFGTSHFSRLLSKIRKGKITTSQRKDCQTACQRQRPVISETGTRQKESGGILNVKCACRTAIQGAKRTQLSSGIPSQWRTAEYFTGIFN